MRRCSKCKETKDTRDFSGGNTYCKGCASESARESYRRNKSSTIARAKAQRKAKKELVASKKRVPCSDCGRVFPDELMQFDHQRDKIGNISQMVVNNRPVEELLAEIEKCQVVCVLCHRHRTYLAGKHSEIKDSHEALIRVWQRR